VPGQALPELAFNSRIFRNGIESLREKNFGALRDHPTSSKTDEWDDTVLEDLKSRFANLHKETRDNLMAFEDKSFTLPERASGLSNVKKLVSDDHNGRYPLLTPYIYSLGN
jgi:hypothetical protein